MVFVILPYDPAASITDQVEQSFHSSLEHLGTLYLDPYILHGPCQRIGLTPDDWAAWRAMESIHASGRTRFLGVSNMTLEQLQSLSREARICPHFIQNRCYAVRSWDRPIREFCAANGMIYQGFSLLTGNRDVMSRPELVDIARRHGRTVSQIIFRFALDVGMLPLTGTTNSHHMQSDLDVFDFHLEPEELNTIENLASP